MDQSVERRLRFWEDKIASFRIAGAGVKGGFPKTELEPTATQEDRVAELVQRVASFELAPDVVGVQVQGSMRDGFSVKSDVVAETIVTPAGVGTTNPPPGTCTIGDGLPEGVFPFTLTLSMSATSSPYSFTETTPTDDPEDGTFYAPWDTSIDGDYWGNGDVGTWCYIDNYGATGGEADNRYFAGPDDCNIPSHFETSSLRYGTVNGDFGWHVVTWGQIVEGFCVGIIDPDTVTFDYLNTFLGATPEGVITRTEGGYTMVWTITIV